MLSCLILGDSIAQGIAQYRPDCQVYAKQGITSYRYNDLYLARGLNAENTVISLGSNDYWRTERTLKELQTLRETLTGRVIWILPANSTHTQLAVRTVAAAFKDTILEIPETVRDGVHPTLRAYRTLADKTR